MRKRHHNSHTLSTHTTQHHIHRQAIPTPTQHLLIQWKIHHQMNHSQQTKRQSFIPSMSNPLLPIYSHKCLSTAHILSTTSHTVSLQSQTSYPQRTCQSISYHRSTSYRHQLTNKTLLIITITRILKQLV
jgi:hypothetical protein